MTLMTVCEPLFMDLCAINRSVNDGTSQIALVPVRLRIQATLADLQRQAQSAGLYDEFAKVRVSLLYFVDWMMGQYPIPLSEQWKKQPLATAEGDTSKGGIFFDRLKEALDDPSPAADDRLEVFYTCLAFGYEGTCAGNPNGLMNVITDVANRIRPRLQTDESICPEAYSYTDRRALHVSTLGPLARVALVCLFLLAVVFIFNGVLYRDRTKSLTEFLKQPPTSSVPQH